MTNTPNARLARVLRLLADVAERGASESRGALARAVCALWYDEEDNFVYIHKTELPAHEAARLAGISADGWTSVERSEDLPQLEERVLVTVAREGEEALTIQAVRLNVTEWDPDREDTVEVPAWCYSFEADEVYGTVTHWRPLPEPYRPEEKTT